MVVTIFDHSVIIKTMHAEFISYFARIFNVFYNFLCVIAAYQQFDKLYYKLCGNCGHKWFFGKWESWVIKKSKTKMAIQNSETISSDVGTIQIEMDQSR